jgi:SAM-dependent methyltransferase
MRLIFQISPTLKRKLGKTGYEYLAASSHAVRWPFMNYGFLDPNARPTTPHSLSETDHPYIQLYRHLLNGIDLHGLDVLEVGCGRGGGCGFIARYLKPRSVVGLDVARRNIAICNRLYSLAPLVFLNGDAEALPFYGSTFDIVINVESSLCYGSMAGFLSEVTRVLRPGGYFLFADFRDAADVTTLLNQLRLSGLSMVKQRTITEYILAALERENDAKRAMILTEIPWIFRWPFRELVGVKGGIMYKGFRSGRLEYLSAILRKADS